MVSRIELVYDAAWIRLVSDVLFKSRNSPISCRTLPNFQTEPFQIFAEPFQIFVTEPFQNFAEPFQNLAEPFQNFVTEPFQFFAEPCPILTEPFQNFNAGPFQIVYCQFVFPPLSDPEVGKKRNLGNIFRAQ